jgi:hypothetical protein
MRDFISDVAQHIKTYHLRIPDEAVAHMKANHWTTPPEGTIDVNELTTE